jgi:YegS/Rv2252/BmrU family lipid kinase
MRKNLLLIVNPHSGKMHAKNELLEIVKQFCEKGYAVRVHITRRRRDAVHLVEKEGKDYDQIAVCGGDGTLNEVFTGAIRSRWNGSIGFLPCGTTNDMARSLGIPKDQRAATNLIVTGEAKDLDVGSFTRNRYFSYIAAFGAFTEVSYSTDQTLKNIFGHAAYVAEAARKLINLRTYHIKVNCDGAEYEDDFLFGSVTNTLSIGGVLKLRESDVELADGYHEVLLIRDPKTGQDFANLSRELFSGHFENKSILFFRGKKIILESEEPIAWCVDGEYAGEHRRVEIRNLSQRLKMIYP